MKRKMKFVFQRYEKKYLLSPKQYLLLCMGMRPYLIADDYPQYTVSNLYYDTNDFELIRHSLDKPLYKEKLRLRSYVTPSNRDEVFLELKKKFSGVVYKRRTTMSLEEALDYIELDEHKSLLKSTAIENRPQVLKEIDWFLDQHTLSPRVLIAYDREAFSGREDTELRITFDHKMRWRDWQLDLRAGNQGMRLLPENPVLMEIKIAGAAPLWLSGLLSEHKVFPCSFSKYGVCYEKHLMRDREESRPRKILMESQKEAIGCA